MTIDYKSNSSTSSSEDMYARHSSATNTCSAMDMIDSNVHCNRNINLNKSHKSSPSSSSTKHHTTSQMAFVFLLLLITSQIVTSAPVADYDTLRSFLELLQRQDNNPTPFIHQMERKGGRSPTLRLRFGRRSDPLWSGKMPSAIGDGGIGNDENDNLSEKVPYK